LTPGWGVVGDVLSIRRHLWEEDVPHSGQVRHWSNHVLGNAVDVDGLPPPLEVGARFDVVIAADVLYFFEQVLATAYSPAVPARRVRLFGAQGLLFVECYEDPTGGED
jgi:hypothetical protein